MTEPAPGRKPVLALLMRLLWAAALVLPVFGASAGVVFTSLHSFTGTNDGANPYAGLVQGTDGNFYGTTSGGTNLDYGTVFKISTNGALTRLYSFTGGNDGANPFAGLVQGSDGNFYGTTSGGLTSNGTVFKISTNGALTSLYLWLCSRICGPKWPSSTADPCLLYGTEWRTAPLAVGNDEFFALDHGLQGHPRE